MAETQKYSYLDACRGYAILLVMMSHSFLPFPAMPWPVLRTTNLGFKGVQLFFVVSSLTLAMSWRRRSGSDRRPFAAFMVRRFFRIAPMFTFALVAYLFIFPPGAKFTWTEALTTATFTNGWSPATIPTVPGAWTAVNGSWSVAVEFGFYLLFPLFAIGLTSLRRSLAAFALTLPLAYGLNRVAFAHYLPLYGETASDQFVFYWLPNQLAVFCLGFVAFFALERLRGRALGRAGTAVGLGIMIAFAALPLVHFARTPQLSPPFIPLHVAASLLFCAFVVVLGLAPGSLFTNRAAVALGKVSFSAYLVHWTFVDLASKCFDRHASGLRAVFYGCAITASVAVLTYVVSALSYRFIEKPMIAIGQRVAERVNGDGRQSRPDDKQAVA